MNFAWPRAEIAVMGAAGAVQILHAKTVKAAEDPVATSKELEDDYAEKFANARVAESRGFLDAVIEPLRHGKHSTGHFEQQAVRKNSCLRSVTATVLYKNDSIDCVSCRGRAPATESLIKSSVRRNWLVNPGDALPGACVDRFRYT